MNRLHPSEYRPLWVTASSGSILEFYRQLASELEIDTNTFSRAVLLRIIRRQILELACNRKQKPVLVIDEASLLRPTPRMPYLSRRPFQYDRELPICSDVEIPWIVPRWSRIIRMEKSV